MGIRNQREGMSRDEAILVLGIYRFARLRAQYGELLTVTAANKIAAIAQIIGIRAERTPSELGLKAGDVWWTTAMLRLALAIVERTRCQELLSRLDTLLQDLTVADVAGYEEHDLDKTEPIALDDTGVHVITRPGEPA